jgi:uncharacterized membrane protein YhaH (DUF805 family)
MSFMDAVKAVLTNYVGFSGRARRSEYWWYMLFYMIVYIVLNVLAGVASIFGIISMLVSLALLLPTIAVGIRRMHDIGKSGWWILVPILNLIWSAQDSQAGQNAYGPSPKAAATTAAAA